MSALFCVYSNTCHVASTEGAGGRHSLYQQSLAFVTVTMSVGIVATATTSPLAIVTTAAASAAFAAVVFDVPAAALPTALLPLRLLLLRLLPLVLHQLLR